MVVADLSAVQLACLDLRRAAFRRLEYEPLLSFLGVRPAEDRASVYRRLEADLSEPSRAFWNSRPEDVAGGVVHAGKFERFFRLFRTRILPLIHSRKTVARLLEPRDEAGRWTFYEETWNNRRWRVLFRLFFSRFVIGRLGRDPEFFKYVEGSVSDMILSRARHALTDLPTHANPYLEYVVTGSSGRPCPDTSALRSFRPSARASTGWSSTTARSSTPPGSTRPEGSMRTTSRTFSNTWTRKLPRPLHGAPRHREPGRANRLLEHVRPSAPPA